MAPGVDITTTTFTINPDGTHTDTCVYNFNGTSAATPNTAAVLALMLSANPNLTGQQARNILESSTDKVGGYTYQSNVSGQPNGTWSTDAGYGRVNACAAMTQVLSSVLSISGDASFCTTSNPYTIPDFPAGSVITWSASPSNIVTINTPNSPTTTLSMTGNGTITLTATISNVCGGQITLSLPEIVVGAPLVNFTLQPQNPNQTFCTNSFGNTVEIQPEPVAGVTAFQWGYSSAQNNIPPTVVKDPGGYDYDYMFTHGRQYQLFARPENECGLGNVETLDINVSTHCGGLDEFTVSPNPASNTVTVSVNSTAKNNGVVSFTQVRIYDGAGI